MTTLVAGTPFRSRTPQLTVENKLDPGAWIFRLVVVDNDGNESAPQDLTVGVRRVVLPPTPTPTPTRVDPRVILTQPISTTPTRPIDPRIIIRRPS